MCRSYRSSAGRWHWSSRASKARFTDLPGSEFNIASLQGTPEGAVRRAETTGAETNRNQERAEHGSGVARTTRGARPRAAEKADRVSTGDEAEGHLRRCPSDTRESQRRGASTRRSTRRPPRPDDSVRATRTCRTSRREPNKAHNSARRSSRAKAGSWSPPTIRRSSCGCSPISAATKRCAPRSSRTAMFTPPSPPRSSRSRNPK